MIKKKIKNIVFLLILINSLSFRINAFNIIRICQVKNNVFITWSKMNDTCSKFISYKIYGREKPSDPFIIIDVLNDYNVVDYIHIDAAVISDKWEYFIMGSYFCDSIKTKETDTVIIDNKAPAKIKIDTVSVVNNKVEIGWSKSKDIDVMGYIIYYVDNNMNKIIDTVYGRLNTLFIDSVINNPQNGIILYKVVAMDSCENLSLFPRSHNTMILKTNNNYCEKRISLLWNGYTAWPEDSVEYEILLKGENDIKFKLFDIVDGFTNSYELKGIKNEEIFEVKVRARYKLNNFTATSTVVRFKTHFLTEPSEIYLSNITVNDNFSVLNLEWNIDNLADIKNFNIYKSENNKQQKLWKAIQYANVIQYSVQDQDVDINTSVYQYKIGIVDSCDAESLFSNEAHNILLKLESEGGKNKLKWNIYENWLGGIEKQNIYEENSNVIYGSVGPSDVEYTDKLERKSLKGEEYCFYVEAEEGKNKFGNGKISKSNKVCITGEHLIYFPSAFRINSGIIENRVFMPKGKLVDYSNSEIFIYNRWGQLVWKNATDEFGWDGKVNNGKDFAEAGVYLYVARIKGKAGEIKKYTGTITLIR